MTPYASFSYFALVALLVAPAVWLGWRGRAAVRWILASALLMLVVHHAPSSNLVPGLGRVRDLWVVLAFGTWQWLLARWLLAGGGKKAPAGRFRVALALALLPLVVVKLAPVLAPASRIGFLGVSYVCFRALDVLFAVRDGLVTTLAPGAYTAFVGFFPALSSGPIDRFRRFLKDYEAPRSRVQLLADLDHAAWQLHLGLLAKFIVAALIKQYWMDPAAKLPGLGGMLSYMYAYSAYLFFDFAGYSGIAIAVSHACGIRVPANFNRPYLATSIQDFWNRWHISLSTWFRDQIYMRFLLANTKAGWLKDKQLAASVGFGITFLLMGLWHGIAWHYVLYGLYHAVLLSGHGYLGRALKDRPFTRGRAWTAASWFLTFHLVCFGFLLFSGHLGAPGRPAMGR